jgi:hypothetical protein
MKKYRTLKMPAKRTSNPSESLYILQRKTKTGFLKHEWYNEYTTWATCVYDANERFMELLNEEEAQQPMVVYEFERK